MRPLAQPQTEQLLELSIRHCLAGNLEARRAQMHRTTLNDLNIWLLEPSQTLGAGSLLRFNSFLFTPIIKPFYKRKSANNSSSCAKTASGEGRTSRWARKRGRGGLRSNFNFNSSSGMSPGVPLDNCKRCESSQMYHLTRDCACNMLGRT